VGEVSSAASSRSTAQDEDKENASEAQAVKITTTHIMDHASKVHNEKVNRIRSKMLKEEQNILRELRCKQAEEEREAIAKVGKKRSGLMDDASKEYEQIQKKICVDIK
jgi:hypothetical protein